MRRRDDVGPAFPTLYLNGSDGSQFQSTDGGMTLRDYFAAHAPALPPDIRNAFSKSLRGDGADLQEHAKVCARWAHLYADAMLAERAK